MIERKIFDFIYLFKFVAIIMITNSHFKLIYGSFKQLAFGGAFGCALFFFCSGFTIMDSKDEPFYNYIKRRFLKILPTFWIFLLLSGEWQMSKHWFCWGHYWFLQAILVFYSLFYFVKKYYVEEIGKIIICMLVATMFLYFVMPHDKWMIDYTLHQNRFTWLYYFAIMLLGARLRNAPPRLLENRFFLRILKIFKIDRLKYWLIPFAFLFVYGLKLFCTKYPVAINFQLLFPVLLMAVCYFFYIIFEEIKLDNKLGAFIKQISNITLEIYIVQFVCIRVCTSLPIPIRFVSVVMMIFVSAYSLHWLSVKISSLIGYGK